MHIAGNKMHYKDVNLNKESARNCGLNQDIRILSEVHTIECSSRKDFLGGDMLANCRVLG